MVELCNELVSAEEIEEKVDTFRPQFVRKLSGIGEGRIAVIV